MPALLWGVRRGLLVAALLHVWCAASLTLTSAAARSTAYRERRWQDSSYASRSMRLTGVALLSFIVYYILHGRHGPPRLRRGAVNHNVVTGFRVLPVTDFYVIATACR